MNATTHAESTAIALEVICGAINRLPMTTENLLAVIGMAETFANAPGWTVDLDLVQCTLAEAVALMEMAAPNPEFDAGAEAWNRELELRHA